VAVSRPLTPAPDLLSVAADLFARDGSSHLPTHAVLLVMGLDAEGEHVLSTYVAGDSPNIYLEIGMLKARLARLMDYIVYDSYEPCEEEED